MANKLYEEQSVVDIADALRLKKDGATATYKIGDMDDAVLEFPFANIPAYHTAEAGRVIKRILDLKAAHPNHIVFGTISDNHIDVNNADVMRSARHAAFALETVGAMAGCDFIANLGDNIVGNQGIDTEDGNANAVYMERASRYAMTSQTAFNLVGNHDKSNSTQALFDMIGKYNEFDEHGATQIRGFGYKDFTDKKVRVIVLNTGDYWNIMGGCGMSYDQKDFLMRSLDVPDGEWQILLLSHIPLDWNGGDYNFYADLQAIFTAFENNKTATITVNSSYARGETPSQYATYSGGNLVYRYDFGDKPKIIANIHGHVHTNKVGKLVNTDIVRIATPNSSFNGNASTDRYTEYGDYSITTAEAAKIDKAANSKADTSATFYFIDLDEQVIYALGYGADIDRTVIYKAVTKYAVTYNLTDVTISNTASEVVEGGSFTATLSVGSGCALDTVTVTMGGTNITSTAYANGVINIASVMGDIVITATAIDNYTPHWDIADRTAVTNVYETKDVAHACVTSRHNYIYGISDTGLIDYRQISDVSLSGNDITFKSGTANYNIGLPYQLEAGASYTFNATASQNARLRVATFDTTGKFVEGVGNSSSGTSLTYTFNANANAGYWTVLMLDVRTAGNTTTFSNISLTKN